ncbi:MAG TPA: hypothetical protein V6C81_08875 [Planktothrix sp.]|jgi:hypothetical protein
MSRLAQSRTCFVAVIFSIAAYTVAAVPCSANTPVVTGETSCAKQVEVKVSPLGQPPDNDKRLQWVKASVLIEAPPEEVFRTIHEERLKDPDLAYSKVIEQISANECRLEQKFNFLPVIGTSVCLMSNSEVPNERIDYWLIRSDHFKAMEGSWVLTPCHGGQFTRLELSSHLDLGIPIPKTFMNSITGKKIRKRLANVKQLAETHAMQMASVHKTSN